MSAAARTLFRLSRRPALFSGFAAAGALLLAGCSEEPDPLSGLTLVSEDRFGVPVQGLSAEELARFREGDVAFEAVFRPEQGLGPVYIRQACASCHGGDNRGPGATRKMVEVEADGFTPKADQSQLPYGHTVRPQATAQATKGGVVPPEGVDDVLVSTRVGPAVFGRGFLEAVLASEIERVEAEQQARGDEITGHVNRVCRDAADNPGTPYATPKKGDCNLVGRFGVKARVATMDEFTAGAYQADMGVTSPLFPEELPNPDALTDDLLPGVDIALETVNVVADYVRVLDLPARKAADAKGAQLFSQVKCAACHVPSMKTDPAYPVKQIAGKDALVYTDLLVHDMGTLLADGMVEGTANGREWRTAPLIGLRFFRTFLHDGRAKTLDEAVRLHEGPGSEANGSVALYAALPEADRQALLAFLATL